MGRPSKLDDLTAKRILDAAAAGVSRKAMAAAALISPATLVDWLARARDGEEPYAAFLIRLSEAEYKAERKVVSRLMEQIETGHVPAMMFWLKCQRAWRENDVLTSEVPASIVADGSDTEAVLESLLAAHRSRKVG